MNLKVFITNQDSTCDECGEKLGHHAWITLVENKGALCLSCADLDHLVFLPAGAWDVRHKSKIWMRNPFCSRSLLTSATSKRITINC